MTGWPCCSTRPVRRDRRAGVMISHANLMHNEEIIHRRLEHDGPGLGVCWLPPYHDMGLIGGLLHASITARLCVLMSPVSFLQSRIAGWPPSRATGPTPAAVPVSPTICASNGSRRRSAIRST